MLHLDTLFDEAEPIATIDGDDYRTASIILCRHADRAITSYCSAADWSATPAGKLADHDATIAALSARIAEHICPECGKPCKAKQGLISHRMRAHGWRSTTSPPPAPVCRRKGTRGIAVSARRIPLRSH